MKPHLTQFSYAWQKSVSILNADEQTGQMKSSEGKGQYDANRKSPLTLLYKSESMKTVNSVRIFNWAWAWEGKHLAQFVCEE